MSSASPSASRRPGRLGPFSSLQPCRDLFRLGFFLALALPFSFLLGCTGDGRDPLPYGTGEGRGVDSPGGAVGREVPQVWRLSDTPELEIGVREGDAAYQLDRASGSTRLDDGRIVVLDGGSAQLRFFDAGGSFLYAVGSEGEGPGEFRNPTRVRRTLGDSLQVWDAILARLSFFDLDGAFLGSSLRAPSPADPTPLDEWLFERNWIDSPLPAIARGPVRRAVHAMPAPDSVGPPRFLMVTREGRIWATQAFPPSPVPSTWTVYDLEGREVAVAEMPARFEPHEIGPDYVLGRFRDELDINFVRLYRLEKPTGAPRGAGLDPTAGAQAPEGGAGQERSGPEVADEVQGVVRQAFVAAATAQEVFYSGNYTYTTDLRALREAAPRGREIPEGVDVAILLADNRGWIGTMTHRETQYMCALAYGAYLPMGWPPGSLICP